MLSGWIVPQGRASGPGGGTAVYCVRPQLPARSRPARQAFVPERGSGVGGRRGPAPSPFPSAPPRTVLAAFTAHGSPVGGQSRRSALGISPTSLLSCRPVGCDYPIRLDYLALQPRECQNSPPDGVITPYTPAL